MDSEPPRKLPRVVYQLGWISLLADVSTEMVYPLVPLFMRTVLKAPVAALGLVEGLAEGIVSIMKGWSGWHSDRSGKRLPYMQWGYGMSALGKPVLAAATGWPVVLGGRLIDRLGKGVRGTARDAYMLDAIDPRTKGRAFGFHRGMDTAGALIGTLVAALLLWVWPGAYRLVFALALIPGLAAWGLTLALKETPRPPLETGSPGSQPTVRETLAKFPRSYWWALVPVLVFSLANSSDTLLLLRANELGLAPGAVVLAYALYNVTYMLTSYPMGVLSDRVGRWKVIAGGWTLYTLVYLGFAAVRTTLPLWGLLAVYGVYIGMTKGVGAALVADHAPTDAKGSAMGFFYMVSGLTTIAASALAGSLWTLYGAHVAFACGAGLAVIALALVPIAAAKTQGMGTG